MARNDSIGFFWQDLAPVKPPKKEKPKRTPPERTWERPDYLPNLQEAMQFAFHLMTPEEMFHTSVSRDPVVFDVECYVNYFLVMFKNIRTGKIALEETYNGSYIDLQRLQWMMHSFHLVSFNGIHYDVPIVSAALAGKDAAQLKALTHQIINEQIQPYIVLRSAKVKSLKDLDHIDLIAHAPVGTGLKKCGARLYAETLQDLPFHHETTLSIPQALIVRWYCANDLRQTEMLFHRLKEPLELRVQLTKEYGVDLRSKSDAQIAEAVIAEEYYKVTRDKARTPNIPPGTRYKYKVPAFLKFNSPLMQWVLETVQRADFVVGEFGAIAMPEELKGLDIKIAGSVYRMGIGGLHSSEKTAAHHADDNTVISDRDVTSFYPFIILLLGLYPPHLGREFLRIYRKLVDRRIAAKKAGNTVVADALKITINGSYGKLASPYSVLYAPDLQIQVTVTGQLVLLMLIERLEMSGFSVVSANTDGIVIKYSKAATDTVNAIVKQWEQDTGFEMEETRYRHLYSRDVNNYIAVYEKPKTKGDKMIYTKTKGVFADPGLQKDPSSRVCVDAVLEMLIHKTPIEQTIKGCTDIRKFLNVRNVPGGAVKPVSVKEVNDWVPYVGGTFVRQKWIDEHLPYEKMATNNPVPVKETITGEYLGKTVRWYYAEGETGEIIKAVNGNSVSMSQGGKPLMKLPQVLPTDINYDLYITNAEKMLVDIGYAPKPPKQPK